MRASRLAGWLAKRCMAAAPTHVWPALAAKLGEILVLQGLGRQGISIVVLNYERVKY